MTLPSQVKIVEVSPRDGLQNEAKTIPSATKIQFILSLAEAGLSTIEATSFVSPQKIPQLADHNAIMHAVKDNTRTDFLSLVPNLQGYNNALQAGAQHIAIFTSASESFCQRNINCSIDESFARFEQFVPLALANNIKIRGYVSCIAGCPYEGKVSITKVAQIAKRLIDLGCYEVSLGDTIGVGTPGQIQTIIQTISQAIPVSQLAGHYHNTYGQALVNIYASMQCGITSFDSSVAGLGGCPYARGASGNMATEDLVYMLNGLNIQTGIDLEKLMTAGKIITDFLGRRPQSQVARALI